MKRPHYADLFRRLMERIYVEPSPSPPADGRRLVAAVEQALRARARGGGPSRGGRARSWSASRRPSPS